MVKYKGKQVSQHRYNQLLKTRENFRELIDSMTPKLYVTRETYEKLVGETK